MWNVPGSCQVKPWCSKKAAMENSTCCSRLPPKTLPLSPPEDLALRLLGPIHQQRPWGREDWTWTIWYQRCLSNWLCFLAPSARPNSLEKGSLCHNILGEQPLQQGSSCAHGQVIFVGLRVVKAYSASNLALSPSDTWVSAVFDIGRGCHHQCRSRVCDHPPSSIVFSLQAVDGHCFLFLPNGLELPKYRRFPAGTLEERHLHAHRLPLVLRAVLQRWRQALAGYHHWRSWPLKHSSHSLGLLSQHARKHSQNCSAQAGRPGIQND